MSKPFTIFAHRGASRLRPENTLPSFKKALQLGANGIELDVQLSKDGHPVVIHDLTLHRTTNGQGMVRKKTLKELKKLDAGSWFHPQYYFCKIPTLEEVCILLSRYPVYINLELKNLIIPMPQLEKQVIHLIKKYHLQKKTIVSSYNIQSLEKVKRLDISIQTALLYFGNVKEPVKMAKDIKAGYIHPPVGQVNHEFVIKSHKANLQVHPYLVNKSNQLRSLLEIGVDGIITENPARMISLLLKKK